MENSPLISLTRWKKPSQAFGIEGSEGKEWFDLKKEESRGKIREDSAGNFSLGKHRGAVIWNKHLIPEAGMGNGDEFAYSR